MYRILSPSEFIEQLHDPHGIRHNPAFDIRHLLGPQVQEPVPVPYTKSPELLDLEQRAQANIYRAQELIEAEERSAAVNRLREAQKTS